MNTIGVVAIAFISGIFLIIIILAVGLSLWASWQARCQNRSIMELLKDFESKRNQETEEFKKILESGRSVFQGIRVELSKNMETQTGEMRQTFKLFEDALGKSLKNLNGKALVEAMPKFVSAIKRMEETTISLHELLQSAEQAQGTPQEWQDEVRGGEHAPEGTSSVRKSVYDQEEQEAAEAFNAVTGGMFQ